MPTPEINSHHPVQDCGLSTPDLFAIIRSQVELTMLAAISADGLIAAPDSSNPRYKIGDFSSDADKEHLRGFIRQSTDCSIMGRVTYELYGERMTHHRIVVLSTQPDLRLCSEKHVVIDARLMGPAGVLQACLGAEEKARVAILGGRQIYDWCLNQRLVDRALVTQELDVHLGEGLAWCSFQDLFQNPVSEHQLAKHTLLREFKFSPLCT